MLEYLGKIKFHLPEDLSENGFELCLQKNQEMYFITNLEVLSTPLTNIHHVTIYISFMA